LVSSIDKAIQNSAGKLETKFIFYQDQEDTGTELKGHSKYNRHNVAEGVGKVN